jgi:hypothetical protein
VKIHRHHEDINFHFIIISTINVIFEINLISVENSDWNLEGDFVEQHIQAAELLYRPIYTE